jgi:hypothetical protein
MHSAQRPAIASRNTGLYLNEGYKAPLSGTRELSNNVYVAVSTPKSPIHNLPASQQQPPLGDALTALSEHLTCD